MSEFQTPENHDADFNDEPRRKWWPIATIVLAIMLLAGAYYSYDAYRGYEHDQWVADSLATELNTRANELKQKNTGLQAANKRLSSERDEHSRARFQQTKDLRLSIENASGISLNSGYFSRPEYNENDPLGRYNNISVPASKRTVANGIATFGMLATYATAVLDSSDRKAWVNTAIGTINMVYDGKTPWSAQTEASYDSSYDRTVHVFVDSTHEAMPLTRKLLYRVGKDKSEGLAEYAGWMLRTLFSVPDTAFNANALAAFNGQQVTEPAQPVAEQEQLDKREDKPAKKSKRANPLLEARKRAGKK